MHYARMAGLCVAAQLALCLAFAGRQTSTGGPAASGSPQHDYPFKPVPFTAVHMDDLFWAPRMENNRNVTIRYAFKECEITGRVANFEHAAEALRGELGEKDVKLPGYPFDDTDIYKVIEGASYTLRVHPDPKLDAYVDSLITKIAAAQEKDGYLYTARTIDPQHPHPWSGKNHAVRATYMYSGMADVAAMTSDTRYVHAIDAIWENVVGKKLYITGGIGATGAGEAFGANYELPNLTAYNETCASVGNDFWNQRLFLLHGDAKYVDVLERTLYNGLISGVSLDGKLFFYQNPLESNGRQGRSPWFGVACCPGNITRFMASVPGYVYATGENTLYVNLFAGSTAEIPLGNRTVKITQETRYPWDGRAKMTVDPGRAGTFAIKVRIPGWARGEPIPSDLYSFVDKRDEPVTLSVNGHRQPVQLDKGYATLNREWKQGDTIELNLPMPVRRIAANGRVAADRGRVAIQRGPIVYAAEWPDNPNGKVRNLLLPDSEKLSAAFRPDLLNGVEVVHTKAIALAYDPEGKVIRHEQEFTAIPYYAWANRGRGEMAVWIADRDAAAKPASFPTLAMKSSVNVSSGGNKVTGEGIVKRPQAVNDGEEPAASNDSSSYFDWWPEKGKTEWIEYGFPENSTVSQVQVYWFDDTGRGEVRVPASWRILYKDGDEWKPVQNDQAYGVEKDRYNGIHFTPLTTSGLRLEVTMQPGWSAGVEKWKVT